MSKIKYYTQINAPEPDQSWLQSRPQWFNQKIGNYLEDFDAERPLKKKYVRRPFIRLVVILAMVIGFILAFLKVYYDASNVRIQRVYLDKHKDYAIQHLFNQSASYGTAENNYTRNSASDGSEILNCPCTNTTISWTVYSHFYTLNYTPPGNASPLNYILDPATGSITALSDNRPINRSQLDPKYLFRNQSDQLTRDIFCGEAVSILPTKYNISSAIPDCFSLVTSFFTTESLPETIGNSRPRWNNPQASNFDSPVLLKQEFLYSNTLQRLYAYIQEQYSRLGSMRPYTYDNKTYRDMYLTGISEIWLDVLDTYTKNSSVSDVDFYLDASDTTVAMFYDRGVAYPPDDQYWSVVLYEGQTFLGMDINWMDYYKACNPSYCDVTKPNTKLRRLFTALTQIGGLVAIVGILVRLLIFPAVLSILTTLFCCEDGIDGVEGGVNGVNGVEGGVNGVEDGVNGVVDGVNGVEGGVNGVEEERDDVVRNERGVVEEGTELEEIKVVVSKEEED